MVCVIVLCTCRHVAGYEGPDYAIPGTDCQKPITIDLALCTELTFLDMVSVASLTVAAAVPPIVSPATILALHLILR